MSIAVESAPTTRLDHLEWLEAEAIYILREVAAQCAKPALLFSGGKDSCVVLRLAEKAFRPGPIPFPLLHIDTGHNFPEVLELRERIGRFVEVYVECPIDALVDRDVKGLYKKALAGEIQNFTGVSDPYEPPQDPEIVVRTSEQTPEESAAAIVARLESLGYLGSPARQSTNGRHG